MSISTYITVEGHHGGGITPGRYITFDADLMFSDLRIREDGSITEIPDERFEQTEEPWIFSGILRARSTDENNTEDEDYFSLLISQGRLIACRPGYDAWEPVQAPAPDSSGRKISVFLRGFEGKWTVFGLPSAAEVQSISISGELFSGADGKDDEEYGFPMQGWLWLKRTEGAFTHAARYAGGEMQCFVAADSRGYVSVPTVMGNNLLFGGSDDHRHQALRNACKILPSDYAGYGGDAVRWDRDIRVDADCSGGCAWWAALHSPERGERDEDWGVCCNPKSPRMGLLTWEHQAGRDCFQTGEEPADPVPVDTRFGGFETLGRKLLSEADTSLMPSDMSRTRILFCMTKSVNAFVGQVMTRLPGNEPANDKRTLAVYIRDGETFGRWNSGDEFSIEAIALRDMFRYTAHIPALWKAMVPLIMDAMRKGELFSPYSVNTGIRFTEMRETEALYVYPYITMDFD